MSNKSWLAAAVRRKGKSWVGRQYPFPDFRLKFHKNQKVTLLPNPYHKKYVGKELYCLKDCLGGYVHFLPVGKTIYDLGKEPFCSYEFVIPYTDLHMILYGVEC